MKTYKRMVNFVSYVALNLNFYIPNKILIDVDDIAVVFFVFVTTFCTGFTQTEEKCVKMIGDDIYTRFFTRKPFFA